MAIAQLSEVELAARLEADDEEEDRHQAVVDPVAQVSRQGVGPETQREVRGPDAVVGRGGDVRPHERGNRGGEQEQRPARFGVQVVDERTADSGERLTSGRPGIGIIMKLLRLTLRVLIGGLFIGHGTQKLFGWFGGHGPEGTGGFFESLGLKPGKRNAIAAGAAEAGGGALLASGVALPAAGAALTATMTTAIRHVHAPKGPWATRGGWEYNAVLIAATLAVVEDECGAAWALGAGLAGVAGAFAVSELGARAGQQADEEFEAVPFQAGDEVREPAQV